MALAVAPRHGGGGSSAAADERTLTELWAALRWLRRRPDVESERIGVVGWSRGGEQALALAAATPLQACAICDAPVPDDPALLRGLQGTALLGLFGAKEPTLRKKLVAFRKTLAEIDIPHKVQSYDSADAGFMGPPDGKAFDSVAADRAWVELYEFLGKYVEDAPLRNSAAPPVGAPRRSPALPTSCMPSTIPPRCAALMQALEQKPAGPRQWDHVRAEAALIAEAGNLLQARTPRKGTRDHWLVQVKAYSAAAETIVGAADRRDYPAAQRGLKELGERCAACHDQHR